MGGLAGFWLVCFNFWVVWLVFGWFWVVCLVTGWFRILAITNIDHAEGISACEEMLSNRKSPSIPTSVISNLLILILQCNTLKFGKRFFHQIKGTAMGTPMACNYANVFMGKFEQLMLRDYEISFNRKPSVW